MVVAKAHDGRQLNSLQGKLSRQKNVQAQKKGNTLPPF
jgi:hypothetical protein